MAQQVVIVTGAKQGIGLGIAKRLANDGMSVVLVDIIDAEDEASALRKKGQDALFISCDVRKPAEVDKMIAATLAKYSRVDALVNNAAVCEWGTVTDHDSEMWDHIVETNLKGPFLCSRAAISAMRRSGGGVILNIGSEYGIKAGPTKAIYSTTKAGLTHLSKVMAVDHASDGVRVNCVIPGPVRTRLMDKLIRESKDPDGAVRAEENNTILKRLGTVEEMAAVVSFLISPAASYITAAVIPVDGGTIAQ